MIHEPRDLDATTLRDRAVAAALGRAPFDILVTGGTLIDVVTGELRPADIGLVGSLIASVHPTGTRRDAATVIDAQGRLVAPGLIDGHMHIESSMITPRRYAETVVPQGTTTACWDPHELGNVGGLDGVRWAIAASRDLPLRVLILAPSCVPSAPGLEMAGASFGGDEMAEMLSWPEVIGVAEVMDMNGVLDRSERMRAVVGAGLCSGKLVCGHARGLKGMGVQGFAAAGIESDHEIISGEDFEAKLRAGYAIELRGSHDYILPEAVAVINRLGFLPPTVGLCTDDVFPEDLARAGGMIDVIRRIVGHGLTPINAIRAATLHNALRLGRRDLGLVAPGRRADLIVLSDFETLAVEHVIANGQPVAADGRLLTSIPARPLDGQSGTVKVPPLDADAFRIRLPGVADGTARVRTIAKPRFTQWGERMVEVRGEVVTLPDDTLQMTVIHRHGRHAPTPCHAILEEWGRWRGAFATTVSHDSHNLTVFGRDSADMAAAANAVIASGGGMAAAQDGMVTAHLPLPVSGLLSDQLVGEVGAAFAAVKKATDAIADWLPPYRVFKALVGASLACNAGPHLTDLGLSDGTTGEIRPLLF